MSAQAADLQAIGDMLLARVLKVGVGRKATVLACLAALRSALDQLSPDERSDALQEIVAILRSPQ